MKLSSYRMCPVPKEKSEQKGDAPKCEVNVPNFGPRARSGNENLGAIVIIHSAVFVHYITI